MHPKTARKIIDNDEELDIALMAEAHLVLRRLEEKHPRIPSKSKSLNAWANLKKKLQSDEIWRRQVMKVWDNNKSS